MNALSLFSNYSTGVITNRESWVYNSNFQALTNNCLRLISFYNSETIRFISALGQNSSLVASHFVDKDETKIKWDEALFKYAQKGKELQFEPKTIVDAIYRPYFKQHLYFNKELNWSRYLMPSFFPNGYDNIAICVNGSAGQKEFSVSITSHIVDRSSIGAGQCFPLFWYEENKNSQSSLFDDAETNRYIRRDGITDWILKEVRNRFGGSRAITKEHIFYYVYGLLHSKQYRERFADDLKKSLPRIPIVDNVQDFMAFYKAGKELADIQLNYEQGINVQTTGHDSNYTFFAEMPMLAHRFFGVKVIGDIDIWQNEWTDETYQYFAVEKMKFAKVRDENGKLVPDKSKIIYNGHITIENIPLKAYEYIVNGKSAIEWVMERYAVTIDKASQIKNDPNDWSREHEQPRYILDLLLSVIILSCQTVDIVNSLPLLKNVY